MKVRWHKSHGNFQKVELVERGETTGVVRMGAKNYTVPLYQLYHLEHDLSITQPIPPSPLEITQPPPEGSGADGDGSGDGDDDKGGDQQ